MGRAMSENDNDFITQVAVTQAYGFAERSAAKKMVIRQKGNRKNGSPAESLCRTLERPLESCQG